MLWKLLLIAIAGGVGTLSRYGLSLLVQDLSRSMFQWGTAAVNLLGCLLFGLVWAITEERFAISGEVRAVVLTGFMGAFTTFSTFVFETGQLIEDSQWMLAFGNVALQTCVGLAALFIGLALGRLI